MKSDKLTENQKKRQEHLQEFLVYKKLKQSEMAKETDIECTTFNRLIRGKRPISDRAAKKIQAAYKDYLLEWFLGEVEYKTESEMKLAKTTEEKLHALQIVLEMAFETVCIREGIKPEETQETLKQVEVGEYTILQALLKDYAESIARSYIHNESHLFDIIKQNKGKDA